MRPGPDDLALSYATGSASFVLDLDPGNYDVWILTGDGGFLEYIPFESYAIEVEGNVAVNYQADEKEFYTLFNTPANDDTIDSEEIYDRYVKPRFQWKKVSVDVSDGQLSVRVIGQKRDRSFLKLLGNYPWSEQRSGPETRFSGALNALIVTPSHLDSESLVDRVEGMRRHNFIATHTKKPVQHSEGGENPEDLRRGYNVYFPDIFDTVVPNTVQAHDAKRLVVCKAASRRHEMSSSNNLEIQFLEFVGVTAG